MATAAVVPATMPDAELAHLAARYDRARRRERAMKRLAEQHQAAILADLEAGRDKTTVVGGWQITRVQSRTPEWDEDGLRPALKPAQRTQLFDQTLDLNALSVETRARLAGMLTAAERREATRWTFNHVLAEATAAAGKLAAAVVEKYRSVKLGAAYVKITRQA